jgi:multidrug efflux pump subunit AcrA (membrane-fusion protein)
LRTLQQLTAPADGVVQQLQVHTRGGIVKPADTLMVIVPIDAVLEIEAMILNKDIGFVRDGLSAKVKFEALPFTRYGTVLAEIVSISRDAVADEKQGLVCA